MEKIQVAPWADRLRQERILRNWRQHDLAEKLGTSVITIQRWERSSHQPSTYFRIKLCTLFGKSAQELGFVPAGSGPASPQEEAVGTRVVREQTYTAHKVLPFCSQRGPAYTRVRIYDPAIPPAPCKENALVGRTSEFHLLKRHLLTRTGSLALYGLPGVGKTALVSALVHDSDIAGRFSEGILWASLGRDTDRFRLLSRWGGLLGLSAQEITIAKSRQFEALAYMLRDIIGMRRMLLILDDAWEVSSALDSQVGGGQCMHLVTTRFPPLALQVAGQHAFALHELNGQDSLTLLRQFTPAVEDIREMDDLVRVAGGLPLALTRMGTYLQVQAHDRQPRRMRQAMEHLHDLNTRLGLLVPHGAPGLSTQMSLSLQAAIALSEQLLHPQARDTFRALSIFPAKPNSFSEAAALAICGVSAADLDRLTDVGLVESASPGRYTLHQVIADYARQYGVHARMEEPMVRFFVDLLLNTPPHDDLLAQDAPNILETLEIAQRRGMASELQQGLSHLAPFLIDSGLSTPGVSDLKQALQAANNEKLSCFTACR